MDGSKASIINDAECLDRFLLRPWALQMHKTLCVAIAETGAAQFEKCYGKQAGQEQREIKPTSLPQH